MSRAKLPSQLADSSFSLSCYRSVVRFSSSSPQIIWVPSCPISSIQSKFTIHIYLLTRSKYLTFYPSLHFEDTATTSHNNTPQSATVYPISPPQTFFSNLIESNINYYGSDSHIPNPPSCWTRMLANRWGRCREWEGKHYQIDSLFEKGREVGGEVSADDDECEGESLCIRPPFPRVR